MMSEFVDACSAFAEGASPVRELWAAFMDAYQVGEVPLPLDGLHLDLFNTLEAWEAAVGDERDRAERALRELAAKIVAADRRT